MLKVLVTGAYGFIGRFTALEFSKQGYYVLGLGHGDWKDNEFKKYGIKEFYNCDITLENLCKLKDKDIDVIVHCAGSGSVAESENNPSLAFNKTVLSTVCCLEFIRICNKEIRFVCLSSAAVYGIAKNFPISEDSELNPVSVYGYHKIMVENICRMYSKQYDLNIIILRLFSVYGQGLRKQLLFDACNKFKNKELIFRGTGLEVRDFIHVNDVAMVVVKAVKYANNNCNIYNVGCGNGVAIKDLVQMLAEAYYTHKVCIRFNGDKVHENPNVYIADIRKIYQWNVNSSIALRQGVKEYVEWYKREAN